MPTIAEIESFLETVRSYIHLGNIDFLPSSKNKYTLSNLGISYEDAFAMVTALTATEYYRGPSPDRRFPKQQIWEFGIENVFEENDKPESDLYVKITIRNSNHNNKKDLLMMSFHSAEESMSFPYREHRFNAIKQDII